MLPWVVEVEVGLVGVVGAVVVEWVGVVGVEVEGVGVMVVVEGACTP
jgi:hypothetical protein